MIKKKTIFKHITQKNNGNGKVSNFALKLKTQKNNGNGKVSNFAFGLDYIFNLFYFENESVIYIKNIMYE